MGLFGRKRASEELDDEDSPVHPLVVLNLIADDGQFGGDDGATISATGYMPLDDDDEPIHHSDHGPVIPGLFLFRIAGMSHHPVGAQSSAVSPFGDVFLFHEPDNEVDSNAVGIFTATMDRIGYAPASLAPSLLGAGMFPLKLNNAERLGAHGVVTKVFSRGTRRVGAEVALPLAGWELQVVVVTPD